MVDPRYRQLQDIVLAALDLPREERIAFLYTACGEDDDLRRQAQAMIDQDDQTGGFLEQPAVAGLREHIADGTTAAATVAIGGLLLPLDQLGPYHLLEVLGKGGMGEVYLAEQTSPLPRRVALKVARVTGPAAAMIRQRFETERQVMARMSHPHIAQVFDAGSSQGMPYLAMELVPGGEPITAFCDRQQLSLDQRLALFEAVCRGVHHAHQKGVLHRDIKPTNVLVAVIDGQPTPKVIDFGIAKGLDPTDQGELTQAGWFVGTPSYMAPEAILGPAGEDADIRTDVYALGVLLHVLLVGRVPHYRDTDSLAKLVESVRREEPQPPSRSLGDLTSKEAALVAERRSTTAAALARQLRGDLDWIVTKTTAHDREQRYPTVLALIADLERHRAELPVSAGPTDRWYRARKLLHRYRLQAAAAALVVLALLIGLAGTSIGFVRAQRAEARMRLEAQEAQRAQAEADEVSHFLVGLFTQSDPLDYANAERPRAESLTARDLLDRGVVRIREELGDQPVVRARLLETLGRVYSSLDSPEVARPLLEEAVALHDELGDLDPAEAAGSRRDLGRLLENLADYDAAERYYRLALDGTRAALGERHPESIASLQFLAKLFLTRGQRDEARPMLEETLRLATEVHGEEHPVVGDILNALAWLHYAEGNLEEAAARFRALVEIDKRVFAPGNPNVAIVQNNLAAVLVQLGEVGEAERTIQAALTALRHSLPAEHWRIANGESVLGAVRGRQGRFEEGEALILNSLPIVRAASGERSPYTRELLARLVDLYKRWGKSEEAEATREQWRAAGGDES